jgi:hypothetical protein
MVDRRMVVKTTMVQIFAVKQNPNKTQTKRKQNANKTQTKPKQNPNKTQIKINIINKLVKTITKYNNNNTHNDVDERSKIPSQ